MRNPAFILTDADFELANSILRGKADLYQPHLILAPDGHPYLYRWYLVGDRSTGSTYAPACVMFHIQVNSDPERPLHDHPWDNQSVILAGRYVEVLQSFPPDGEVVWRTRNVGDVITRRAREAHRLLLPDDVHYTMTLFSTGPKVREWGFWYGDDWHHNQRHIAERNGVSVHVHQEKVA